MSFAELAFIGRHRKTMISVLILLLALSLALSYARMQDAPVDSNAKDPVRFTIQSGWGVSRIATELKKAELIKAPWLFTIEIDLLGASRKLQAGDYELSPAMTTMDIARTLADNRYLSNDIIVTIPEGMNVWEIDDLLASKSLIVPGSFARTYQSEEGRLFPDTYRFARSLAEKSKEYSNAKNIGSVLIEEFQKKTKSYTREQVILASILEKEAKTEQDMALVAGIIANRRKINMPLQIDATVAYGWCLARWLPMSSNRNCDVTQAPIATEIKVDGSYNTYTRKGLPVGPVSNPGLKALRAAANPQSSDYLYYLSTRDGSQIIYSKTIQEHNRNRSKYLGL